MKKLLVLVLAVASLANAISFTGAYNPSTDIVTISCTADPETCYIALAITDGGGTLSNFAAGAQAPPDSHLIGPVTGGELWQMIHITTGTPVYVTGEWLTADFSGSIPSIATYYEYDLESESFIELGTINIPEPGTIALLCLGGLMLRRRK